MKEFTREQLSMKVNVTYPDGKGNYDCTVMDVINKWKNHGESDSRIDWFISLMIERGYNYSNAGAKYEIIK